MNHAQPISDTPTVDELAGACRRGDERAFRNLVELLLPDAMALAIQFVRRRESAEDIVQESFLRMARALPTYDPKRPFRPWFFTVVRNCARTHAAKVGRRRLEGSWRGALPDGDEGADVGQDGLKLDLARTVGALPAMQQRCVRLCLFEGYTSAEAAVLLDVREGTVRTHVKRARTRLRALLDEAGDTR